MSLTSNFLYNPRAQPALQQGDDHCEYKFIMSARLFELPAPVLLPQLSLYLACMFLKAE